MKLPKIPIDYSKAGTGEAPFDGGDYILHTLWGGDLDNGDFTSGHWESDEDPEDASKGVWWFVEGFLELGVVTHYTPMPEFETVEEQKESE